MPSVTIGLLGSFSASVDGVPVARGAWRLRKARDLVKLLALAPGRRLHREQVMDALWPELAPEAAANNLYQAAHAARRAIGAETISVREEMLALAPEVEVDVALFEERADAALRAGSENAIRRAVALYAGELLPENRYDDWCVEPRERLAALHSALLEHLDDPSGRPALGGLPGRTSSFIGRAHELGELLSLLRRTRLLTLTGTGGSGKTRLALELARNEEPGFTHGATMIDLSPARDRISVWAATAVALDVTALPGETLPDAVGSFLADRSALLLVDNCEHVIGPSAELVEAILQRAPDVSVIATSREPLRHPAELVFRVPSLAIPDPARVTSAADLAGYESVRLFAERASAVLPSFAIDEANAADVARICFRLDGLPLALELAAGRLGALSPRAVSERLDDRFQLLRAGSRIAPTRQQTLLATLDWSHELLDEDERVLFRRVATFVGGFRLEAAERVCAGPGLPEETVANVLARLVEKSLVTVDERDGGWRYRLLDTVGAYADDRLTASGERLRLSDRHAAWALVTARAEGQAPMLDAEAGNLRAALDHLLANAPDDALEFCVAVWPFWLRRIDLIEAERRFATVLQGAPDPTPLRAKALVAAASIDLRAGTVERGIARVEEAHEIFREHGDERGQWRTLQLLGDCAIAIGDSTKALRLQEGALKLARSAGLPAEAAACVNGIGVSRWVRGELEEADRLIGESVVMFDAASPATSIESPLNITESRLRNPDGSQSLRVVFEDTLQPFVDVTSAAAIGYILANQAAVARQRGDAARADLLLDRSEARFAGLGDERGKAFVLGRRAFLRLEEGDIDSARNLLERSLDIRTRLRDRRAMGIAQSGLGAVETAAAELERASMHLEQARDVFRRAGDRWGLVSTLWRIADVAAARGDLDEAWETLEAAQRVLAETKRDRWYAHTLAAFAEVALLRGDEDEARALLERARSLYASEENGEDVAAIDRRLSILAKNLQSSRKDRSLHTRSIRPTKG